jgi:transcriptional regulator with XRE-family HTH domain
MAAQKPPPKPWSERVVDLLKKLNITQAGLAERLGVSPATVSRWVQGKHEPTAEGYVALGNLAGRPAADYFWERAGMDLSTFPDSGLRKAVSAIRGDTEQASEVSESGTARGGQQARDAVVIPLLHVAAFGDRVPPHQDVSLANVKVDEMLAAPRHWCPNPEHMIGMHMEGDSMAPLIVPGSILFVDTSSIERERLHQKIVVVSHRDLGFKVARLQRLAGLDLLVSANHRCAPLDVTSTAKWKIFGQVLWWVSRDEFAARDELAGRDAEPRA